jgi:hypothetical protein
MLDKLENLEGDASSVGILEGIVKDLETELSLKR